MIRRFGERIGWLVAGCVLGGVLAAWANVVLNPGFESGVGPDADSWTESLSVRLADQFSCHDEASCLRMYRLNLRNPGGDGQETVNPCTANGQSPPPDWTQSAASAMQCANTDTVSGTYRFAVISSGYGYQALGVLRAGYTYTVSAYGWHSSAGPTASLIVGTVAGGGGIEYCNVSTTTITKPASPNLTCNITPSSDTASVYLSLKTAGAGSRFDEVTITPMTSATSTAISVGSYTNVTASGLFRGGGGSRDWGRIEILDHNGAVISGCTAESQPLAADWTNRITVASCAVGSATSVQLRVRSMNSTVDVDDVWLVLQSSALAAPTGVTVTDPGLGGDSALVRFNATTTTTATQHRLYRSTVSGSGYTLVKTLTDLKQEWWIDTGLTAGTPYYYVMRTYDGTTESGNSAEASVTPNYPSITSGSTLNTAIAGRMMQVDPYISDTSNQDHGGVTGGYPDFGSAGTDIATIKTRMLEAKPSFVRMWMDMEHLLSYTVPSWTLSGTTDDRGIINGGAEDCTSDGQSPPPGWSQVSATQIYCTTGSPAIGTYRFSVANGGYGYQAIGVLTAGQSYTFQAYAWNQTSATAAMKVSSNSDGTGTVYCDISTTTTTQPVLQNLICHIRPTSTTGAVYLVLTSTGGTGVSRFDEISHDTFRPEPWIYNNTDGASAAAMTVPSGIYYLRVPYGHHGTQAVTLAASTAYTISIQYQIPKAGATAKISLETTPGGVGSGNVTRCSNTGTTVGGTTFTALSCAYTTGASPETAYVTVSCLTDTQCWFDDASVSPVPTTDLSNKNFDSSTMSFSPTKAYAQPGHRRTTVYATIYDQWIQYLEDQGIDVLLVNATHRTGSFPSVGYHGDPPTTAAYAELTTKMIDAITWFRTTRGLSNVKYVSIGNEMDWTAGWVTPSFYATAISDLRTKLDTAGFAGVLIYEESDSGWYGTFAAATTKWSNATLKSTLNIFAVTMYGSVDVVGDGPFMLLWQQKGHRTAYDNVSDPKPRLATFEIGITEGNPYNPLTVGQGVDTLGTLVLARALAYGTLLGYDSMSYWMGPQETVIGERHIIRWGGLMYKDAATFYGGGAAAWDRKASWQLVRTYGSISGGADVQAINAESTGSLAYPHLGFYAQKSAKSFVAYQDKLALAYWPIESVDTATINDAGDYDVDLGQSGTPTHASTGGWDNGAYYSFTGTQKLTLASVPTYKLPVFWAKASWCTGGAFKAAATPAASAVIYQVLAGSTSTFLIGNAAAGNRLDVQVRESGGGSIMMLDAESPATLWNAAWHLVTLCYNGKHLVLSVDGSPIAMRTKTLTLYESPAVDAPETTAINLGVENVSIDDWFLSRYLTPTQISTLNTNKKFATLRDTIAAPQVRVAGLAGTITKRQWLASAPLTYSESPVSSSGGYVTVALPYGSNTVLDGTPKALWWWEYYR